MQQKYPNKELPAWHKRRRAERVILAILQLLCPSESHLSQVILAPCSYVPIDGLENMRHYWLGNKYTFRRLKILGDFLKPLLPFVFQSEIHFLCLFLNIPINYENFYKAIHRAMDLQEHLQVQCQMQRGKVEQMGLWRHLNMGLNLSSITDKLCDLEQATYHLTCEVLPMPILVVLL